MDQTRTLRGLAVLGLTAFFLGLGAAMFFCAPSLYDTYDFWFGTDIPRHVLWATTPSFVFRAHLHPLSFLLFRSLGTLFHVLHLHAHEAVFLACSAPSAFLASTAIVSAARIAPPGSRLLAGLGGVFLGSTLFFAPIPESHTLGGSALLLEGTAVFWARRAGPEGGEATTARLARAAVRWGWVAVGMSISNALPSLLLLAPLWPGRAASLPLLRRLAGAALAMLLLEIVVNILQARSLDPGGVNSLSLESDWLARPTLLSFGESLSSLFLHLFGLPPVHRVLHRIPSVEQMLYILIYPRQLPAPLQCAAAACWCLGVALGWKRASACYRKLTLACLAALLGLVAFSAAYDTYEAYMVSAHTWPLLLLPALALLREAPSPRSAPARLITACICLSLFQTCLSLPHAYFLLTHF